MSIIPCNTACPREYCHLLQQKRTQFVARSGTLYAAAAGHVGWGTVAVKQTGRYKFVVRKQKQLHRCSLRANRNWCTRECIILQCGLQDEWSWNNTMDRSKTRDRR